MGYATYIGRVGGLAIALGVGVAIATTPGIAWADESDPSPGGESTTASESQPDPASTSESATGSTKTEKPKPKVVFGNTDGGRTSKKSAEDTARGETAPTAGASAPVDNTDPQPEPKRATEDDDDDKSRSRNTPDTDATGVLSTRRSGLQQHTSTRPPAAPRGQVVRRAVVNNSPDPHPPSKNSAPQEFTAEPAQTSSAPQAEAVAVPKTVAAPEDRPVSPVNRVVLTVLGVAGADRLATNGPLTPVESPFGLAMIALARKQFEQDEKALQVAGLDYRTVSTSQTMENRQALVAADNLAPVTSGTPTGVVPDQTTGVVVGSLNVSDPDGDALTYTVTGAPANGTVSVDDAGTYTYTPTAAARVAAGQTAGGDYDTFTVTVSDGQHATPVAVSVPVSSTQPQLDPTITGLGINPSAVVVTTGGDRLYVANTGSNTISVIDARTGRLIDTNPTVAGVNAITVGSSPSALAINQNGTRLYVANTGSNTVSVIDTSTYRVIDTNTAVAGTNSISVGSAPSALALSADGSRLYVANRTSNTVSVIDTSTYRVIDTNTAVAGTNSINVGSSPSALALSPNGTKLYVVNTGSGTVSVIDTATNVRIDADPTSSSLDIRVGGAPTSVALSPDGSLAYVANGPDTISVINTKTNTVARTVTIDPTAESGGHVIAVDADGTVYVTDAFDRNVRVVSLANVNTAPQSTAQPTVGSPNPDTGTVAGLLSVRDIDGDPLSYGTVTGPANGTVVYDAATGAYTYTPTQAAREQAARSATEDYDHFTVAVSDGRGGVTNVAVTVPISPKAAAAPEELDVDTSPITVSNPNGVAVVDNRAYVIGTDPYTGYGVVSVVDTANGELITTIPVDYGSTRIVASHPDDDEQRVYVANFDTVSVIDADPTSATYNTVLDTIAVPTQCGECYNGVWDVAVSPDGDRVYAARGDGTVSVIDADPTSATYHQVISTTPVGFFDGDLEISEDGDRLYAATGYSDGVVVLDSSTLQPITTVDVGPEWDLDSMRSETTDVTYHVAVSPDGTQTYVTQRVLVVERGVGGQTSGWFVTDSMGRNWLVRDHYSAVSVIDSDPTSATYNTEIARITVPDGAYDVAFNHDGSRAYVTHSDGKSVTVIDTATNSVVGTFSTDQNSATGSRTIAVGSDNTLYIADYYDNSLYASVFGTVL
ncbi:beta-propeller fold lactonase family protein [Mycolicibacterium wolinskyi]|uniref:beta-propeller fold lactonase family protein n=1 Tax=Mycolicibacterium wolinskyi TaxID=59750 RepID=UPI0039177E31